VSPPPSSSSSHVATSMSAAARRMGSSPFRPAGPHSTCERRAVLSRSIRDVRPWALPSRAVRWLTPLIVGCLLLSGCASSPSTASAGARPSGPPSLRTEPSPAGRSGAFLAIDPDSGDVVLYGGLGGVSGGGPGRGGHPVFLHDTWVWHGGGWRRVGGDQMPTVASGVMGADPSTDSIVLAGADDRGNRTDNSGGPFIGFSTWVLRDGIWRRAANSTGPGATFSPAGLAYDAHLGGNVLFGASVPASVGGPDVAVPQAWTWRDQAWRLTWEGAPVADPLLLPRYVAEGSDGRIVGVAALRPRPDSNQLVGTTEVWDDRAGWRSSGVAWTPASITNLVGLAGGGLLAFGSPDQRAGEPPSSSQRAYRLTGTTWLPQSDGPEPSARSWAAMAASKAVATAYLFGGSPVTSGPLDPSAGPPLADLWRWSADGWSRIWSEPR